VCALHEQQRTLVVSSGQIGKIQIIFEKSLSTGVFPEGELSEAISRA